MASFKSSPGLVCIRCQEEMAWVSEQIVDAKPVQVFHCDTCKKYSAVSPGTNGVQTRVAPSIASGF